MTLEDVIWEIVQKTGKSYPEVEREVISKLRAVFDV